MKVRVTVVTTFDIGPESRICTMDEWNDVKHDREWVEDMLRDDVTERANSAEFWTIEELP